MLAGGDVTSVWPKERAVQSPYPVPGTLSLRFSQPSSPLAEGRGLRASGFCAPTSGNSGALMTHLVSPHRCLIGVTLTSPDLNSGWPPLHPNLLFIEDKDQLTQCRRPCHFYFSLLLILQIQSTTSPCQFLLQKLLSCVLPVSIPTSNLTKLTVFFAWFVFLYPLCSTHSSCRDVLRILI